MWVRAVLLWTWLFNQIRENSYHVLGELGALDGTGELETLDNYSEYQGKTEHFWYFEQASNTRRVLEAKSSEVETPLVV